MDFPQMCDLGALVAAAAAAATDSICNPTSVTSDMTLTWRATSNTSSSPIVVHRGTLLRPLRLE
jgi:hypothetical protein